MKAKGLKLINEEPYLNAHKDLVAFIHPKSTYGILIELIQTEEQSDGGPAERGGDSQSMESRIRVRDGE